MKRIKYKKMINNLSLSYFKEVPKNQLAEKIYTKYSIEIEKAKAFLDINPPQPTDIALIDCYNFLCEKEKTQAGLIKFNSEIFLQAEAYGLTFINVKRFLFRKKQTYSIFIYPDIHWILYLIHEFTHHYLFENLGNHSHDNDKDELLFIFQNAVFLEKYFEPIYFLSHAEKK